MDEIWKEVKGFEEFYEVSNLGRVRSKDRYYFQFGFGWRRKKGRVLSLNHNGNGYLCVSLHLGDGKRNMRYIHRLVAEAFIPKIDGKNCVNHIDRNRANNNVNNLEWCNYSENVNYSLPYRKKRNNCKHAELGFGIRKRKHNRYEVGIDRRYLGTFSTLEEAIKCRDDYLRSVDG